MEHLFHHVAQPVAVVNARSQLVATLLRECAQSHSHPPVRVVMWDLKHPGQHYHHR